MRRWRRKNESFPNFWSGCPAAGSCFTNPRGGFPGLDQDPRTASAFEKESDGLDSHVSEPSPGSRLYNF